MEKLKISVKNVVDTLNEIYQNGTQGGNPFGKQCVLMKEMGLYELTPATCHLDHTMS